MKHGLLKNIPSSAWSMKISEGSEASFRDAISLNMTTMTHDDYSNYHDIIAYYLLKNRNSLFNLIVDESLVEGTKDDKYIAYKKYQQNGVVTIDTTENNEISNNMSNAEKAEKSGKAKIISTLVHTNVKETFYTPVFKVKSYHADGSVMYTYYVLDTNISNINDNGIIVYRAISDHIGSKDKLASLSSFVKETTPRNIQEKNN